MVCPIPSNTPVLLCHLGQKSAAATGCSTPSTVSILGAKGSDFRGSVQVFPPSLLRIWYMPLKTSLPSKSNVLMVMTTSFDPSTVPALGCTQHCLPSNNLATTSRLWLNLGANGALEKENLPVVDLLLKQTHYFSKEILFD